MFLSGFRRFDYQSNRVFERREAPSVPAAMDDACIFIPSAVYRRAVFLKTK
jgi:hypothetical protein